MLFLLVFISLLTQTAIRVLKHTFSESFYRSITYTVNSKHAGHILVTAKTVPVALELSSHELILKPNNDFLAEAGFRSSIRLYNRRNHPAEFSWKPIITEKGIAFSIRPARGNSSRALFVIPIQLLLVFCILKQS